MAHIQVVAFFSDLETPVEIPFYDPSPAPEGLKTTAVLVDRSFSMVMHTSEIAVLLADITRGTNAEGKIEVSCPSGRTAIIQNVHRLAARIAGCNLWIVTDGFENCQRDKIFVTNTACAEPGNATQVFDFSEANTGSFQTPKYTNMVADFLRHACQATLYFVGIGEDSKHLASSLVNRRDCYPCHIPKGTEPAKIVGTLKAIKMKAAKKERQEHLIVELSDEAKAALATISEQEMRDVLACASSIKLPGGAVFVPPRSDRERLVEQIESSEEALASEFPSYDKMSARAALLVSLDAMAHRELPSALFGGKIASIFETSYLPRSFLNKIFSLLSKKGILKRGADVPENGTTVEFDGVSHKIAKKTWTYLCTIPSEAIKELSDDTNWVAPRESVKRKRGGSSSASVGSSAKKCKKDQAA